MDILVLFGIPHHITVSGVKYVMRYPYLLDSFKSDKDALKQIWKWIRCENYPT
jgi:hypothetical protein